MSSTKFFFSKTESFENFEVKENEGVIETGVEEEEEEVKEGWGEGEGEIEEEGEEREN